MVPLNHLNITAPLGCTNNCSTCSVFSVWLCEGTLRRLEEYNDLNDVTLAHEDGIQVRQTRSSCHCQIFQIKVWVLFGSFLGPFRVLLGGEVQY